MRRLLLGAECAASLVLACAGLKVMKLPGLSRAGCLVFGCLYARTGRLPKSAALETAAWVDRASEFLPGMLCLQQALATQWMMARRSVACTLHVGVSGREGDFRSHAWVTYQDRVLIGGQQAPGEYREILRCEGVPRGGNGLEAG